VLIVVAVSVGPTIGAPLFAHPPEILGIPIGVVADGLALLWMAIGVTGIWEARSPAREVLYHLAFTVPATLAILISPAVILIMQNLAV
jgi:hypothetical protein